MASLPAEGGGRRRLPQQQYLEIVDRAPLISIDLIVRDPQGRVLVGLRRNAPARDWWFVPGGTIRKGETLDAAFTWTARDELGLSSQRADARFLGVYQHFYDDNAGDLPGFGTHYVVLGYALQLDKVPELPREQHSAYRWLAVDALLNDPAVHENTKAYFL